jgi:hypothetical protein
VKAIFPILAGNDLYRELLFQGGIPDAEFDVTTGLPVISSLSALNPVIGPSVDAVTGGAAGVRALADSNARLLPTEMQHATTLGRFVLPTAAGVLGLGGAADVAYDEAWWAARNMTNYLAAVVDHHIPAFLVGGWSDLFPRGELLNYVGLQNLWAGRSQGSPMTAGQPVTPRYQLAMGPWTHLTTDAALVQKLELEWFDRWRTPPCRCTCFSSSSGSGLTRPSGLLRCRSRPGCRSARAAPFLLRARLGPIRCCSPWSPAHAAIRRPCGGREPRRCCSPVIRATPTTPPWGWARAP